MVFQPTEPSQPVPSWELIHLTLVLLKSKFTLYHSLLSMKPNMLKLNSLTCVLSSFSTCSCPTQNAFTDRFTHTLKCTHMCKFSQEYFRVFPEIRSSRKHSLHISSIVHTELLLRNNSVLTTFENICIHI